MKKFAFRILQMFCPPDLIEEIEGDLLQRFKKDVSLYGSRKAKRKLFFNTLKFFRPGIISRNRKSSPRPSMIRNYLKIATRNILKQKSYSLLNIIGLSLGMAASLLILQYVKYEKSFDAFHDKPEDIYRIQYNIYHNGELNVESAVAVPAIKNFLKSNFPEVEEATRILAQAGVMAHDEVRFQENKVFYAAPDFLRLFNVNLLEGDRAACLDGTNKIAISQSAAKKYFGEKQSLGQRLTFNGESSFEVTAVFEDLPQNSHFHPDFLMSYATLKGNDPTATEEAWGWYDFYTFVRLQPGTDVAEFQSKLNAQLEKERGEIWRQASARQEFILRPLLDIHLNSKLLYELEPQNQRDGSAVYSLGIVAFFILAIAWINYINLATARSLNRANEVGVRKVMGALKNQLINQFLTESLIMNALACLLAIIIVRLSWSWFSDISGWNIPLSYLNEPGFWTLVGGLFLAGTILSGFYPAIVLSSFKPVAVLKGKLVRSAGGEILRKSLVVIQFSASVFLIIGSLVVYNQLHFMKSQDLGLSIDDTLVLRGPGILQDSTYASKLDGFKKEIQRIAGIKSITASSTIPGHEIFWSSNVRLLTSDPRDNINVAGAAIDQDFINAYGVKLLAGRNFDHTMKHDDRNKRVILNLALCEKLGFRQPKDAVGKLVVFADDTLEVLAVSENFHQMSLKNAVTPILMGLGYSSNFFSLKVETTDYQSLVTSLQEPWDRFFPGNPIEYFFLDEFFDRQYDKDDRFGLVFNLFTFLGILIASLGLFGLASFMALQRTKEIGIRKVLGANVSGIMVLLAHGFMKPVLIANLIAWPLAWLTMDRWLQKFPYHISVNPLYFMGAGVLVIVIAFISVSSQTLKAALTKPADTLKYE